MSILALVYVECHFCGDRQPLQDTRPRYIDLTACAKWLRAHGWSGNHGTCWLCPQCTVKDSAKRAEERARQKAK